MAFYLPAMVAWSCKCLLILCFWIHSMDPGNYDTKRVRKLNHKIEGAGKPPVSGKKTLISQWFSKSTSCTCVTLQCHWNANAQASLQIHWVRNSGCRTLICMWTIKPGGSNACPSCQVYLLRASVCAQGRPRLRSVCSRVIRNCPPKQPSTNGGLGE